MLLFGLVSVIRTPIQQVDIIYVDDIFVIHDGFAFCQPVMLHTTLAVACDGVCVCVCASAHT